MAGKLKGQGNLKGLFLLHGEKLGIAIVALAAVWLIYKSTSLPHLEEKYQATKLQSEIQQTSSKISSATWPDANDPENGKAVSRYQEIDEKLDHAIASDIYVNKDAQGKPAQAFDIEIVKKTIPRPDPVLLNAVEVRAAGGYGLLSFMDEDVRKRRDLERAEAEARKAQEAAEKAAKENENNQRQPGGQEGGPGARRRGGEGGLGDGGSAEPFDAAHPDRRPLDGNGQALGVPLQGGERIELAYWAVVTAKVPIREQLKIYQDAFEKSKAGFDPMRDFPQYKGYLVQRAEVIPGQNLDWKAVPVYDGQQKAIKAHTPLSPNGVGASVMEKLAAKMAEWAGMPADVIDPRFVDYVLTFPLPPLVGRDWGSEAKHPDFPSLAETPPLQDEVQPMPTDTPTPDKPGTPADENAAFASGTGGGVVPPGPAGGMSGRGMGRPGGGGGLGMGRGMGPEGGGGFRPSGGMRGLGGEEGGPRGMGPRGMGGGMGGGMPAAGVARTSLPKGVDFLMLRFFDFTVEPGKKYKYRVQLVMADANYAIPKEFLAAEVLDRHDKESKAARARNQARSDIRRIETWSDPSPTAGIPLAGGVRLVDVKPATPERINDEPATRLLVESIGYDEKNNAIQASVKKEKFVRGTVANLTDDGWYIGEGWIDKWKSFKFVTGMTIVDIDGGKKLAKDYSAPGRLLVMGPAGELYIRNEIDDKPSIDHFNMLFDEETRRRLQGPGAGEMEGGPGQRGPRGAGRPRGGGRGEN